MSLKPSDQFLEKAAAAQQQGRLEEAASWLHQVDEGDSGFFKAQVRLSLVLRLMGNIPQAAEAAARARKARPHAMEGHLQFGLCSLAMANFGEAAEAFRAAIKIQPNLAPLHHNLGLCLENLGQMEDAAQCFRAAMRIAPTDVRSRISLGSIYLAQEQLVGALDCAQSALRLDPRSSDAHVFMAKVLCAQLKDSEAEPYMRKAVELDPNSALAHSKLGFRLLQKGEFEESETCFETSIQLDPLQGIGYFGITQGRKMTLADSPLIEQMKQVFESGAISYDELSYLAYGLAKSKDNLGDYGAAMSYFQKAHEYAYFIKGGKPVDRDAYRESADAAISRYSRENLTKYAGCGFDSDLPIFIVGMMRSGTTLTEQILSSHPDVGASGENDFWPNRGRQADAPEGEIYPDVVRKLGREYCRELQRAMPGRRKVTDKLPGNFQRLGLLSLVLPKAKVIHTRRNPLDTCLSIYFTPNPIAPPFAHSASDIIFAYREYQRLMGHWRAVLDPENFLEIDYEALVDDPEPIIRKIVAFCGLEWDDACLRHENNAKAVRTPSLWQVRQPVYRSSSGRWKNYRDHLGDFAELLSDGEIN